MSKKDLLLKENGLEVSFERDEDGDIFIEIESLNEDGVSDAGMSFWLLGKNAEKLIKWLSAPSAALGEAK